MLIFVIISIFLLIELFIAWLLVLEYSDIWCVKKINIIGDYKFFSKLKIKKMTNSIKLNSTLYIGNFNNKLDKLRGI